MEIKECIILAGGMGTRLRSEVPDLPKCMAPVAGKPFLHWVIEYLLSQHISSFVFSLGYMHEKIEQYIASDYPQLDAKFSVEDKPLGTGGAIQLALKLCNGENVLAVNGDTIFKTDNSRLLYYHINNRSACTLALKPMENYDRYGSVQTDIDGTIISFTEKKYTQQGLVNGGVYLINRLAFEQTRLPKVFSFEKDYLEKYCGPQKMVGVPDDGYFIDIGIPEDFKKANEDINAGKDNFISKITDEWTLFLDRDGVINHEKKDDYINTWEDFIFYEGVTEAFEIFARKFRRIIIVTNQRGVGRGITKPENLEIIHNNMRMEISKTKGRVDAVYFCTDVEDSSARRKPNAAMGLEAAKDFPDIDLSRSLIVGNRMSDMNFGRNLGIYTVYLTTTHPLTTTVNKEIDVVYPSLQAFAHSLI